MRSPYAPINKKICGSGSVTMAAHDAVEPSVVKYFPPLPPWLGRLTGAGAHATPGVAVDVAVRRYPSVPTGSRATVSSAVPTSRSPLALIRVPDIAEAIITAACVAEFAAEVADVAAAVAEFAADVAEVAAAVALLSALVALVAAAVWLVSAEAADVAAAVWLASAEAVNVATLR
jgi:hypothetical protein